MHYNMPTQPTRTRGTPVPVRKTTVNGIALSAKGALLHRQLYVLLKEHIASGRYRPGDLLPTQEALCRQFSISRITVRRALTDLVEEGWIRNRQGVGAFVTAKPRKAKAGLDFSFIGDMRRTLKETTMRILHFEIERCPPAVGAALGLAEGDEALHLVRTRSVRNRPVTLLDGWIPQRFAGSVTRKGLQKKSLHESIAGSFEKLGRVAQEVNAALADPVVAQALGVEINSAVLKIVRLVHNRDGAPVHYVSVWTTPARTRLVMEVSADDIDGYNVGRLLHDVRQ
jgi:GntR family transcriptional regulator